MLYRWEYRYLLGTAERWPGIDRVALPLASRRGQDASDGFSIETLLGTVSVY